ncbi:MAG: hypothetical protein M1823_003651 [Watsoniomyces obsoletus]|nr:MAG: hypothetical protein M1823_003651 [Watsoniomyces obsoletus]
MDRLAAHLATNPNLLRLFSTGYNPSQQNEFVKSSTELLVDLGHPHSSSELWSNLCAWISKNPDRYPEVTNAWTICRKGIKDRRALHKRLVTDLNLRQSIKVRNDRLNRIPVVHVTRRSTPYPPMHAAVYENDKIGTQWRDHIKIEPQPDPSRPGQANPLLLKVDQLQYNLGPSDSAIFKDIDTGDVIGIVIRNFIPHVGVQTWAEEIISAAIAASSKRNDNGFEDEDTGKKMTLEGEGCTSTAGARKNKSLFVGWARNLDRRFQPHEHELRHAQYRSSSLFALFWNCLLGNLPSEVTGDFVAFLEQHSAALPGMDSSNLGLGLAIPRYTVQIDGLELEFHGGQLAPPSGAFVENYSREIHVETSPHRYIYSWYNRRSSADDQHGGNFFLAQYAIRIAGSENMCLVHEARQAHGTGLPDQDVDGEGTSLFTSGLTIFTHRDD